MTRHAASLVIKFYMYQITVFCGLVPLLSGLSETHRFNPRWSERARFHYAWLFIFSAKVAPTAHYLVWRRSGVLLPVIFGLLLVRFAWVATVFSGNYRCSRIDSNKAEQTILDMESNLFVFSMFSVLLAIGLSMARWFYRFQVKTDE